jgi:hypothetical protein
VQLSLEMALCRIEPALLAWTEAGDDGLDHMRRSS